jgi:hypothetical protein
MHNFKVYNRANCRGEQYVACVRTELGYQGKFLSIDDKYFASGYTQKH